MTASFVTLQKYVDKEGILYGVEKASNGNWVVIRVNAGGNRKLAKAVGDPQHTAAGMQRRLDAFAAEAGWRKAVVI